ARSGRAVLDRRGLVGGGLRPGRSRRGRGRRHPRARQRRDPRRGDRVPRRPHRRGRGVLRRAGPPGAAVRADRHRQQPFNTLYQLVADDRLAALPEGSSLLMLPDLIGYLLTGRRRTERTNASSTGMLALAEQDWSHELLDAAGVDPALLAPLLSPGERLGTVLPQLAVELGIGEVPVIAVGSHDTASAVLAVPAAQDAHPVAYISSGTWSLIGLELGA